MQRSKTDLTAAVALREYAAGCRSWSGSRPPPKCWPCAALRGGSPRWSSSGPGNATASMRCRRRRSAGGRRQRHRGEHPPPRAPHRAAHRGGRRARSREHAELHRAFERLTSVPGIATHSAVQLLPELLVLPDDMTVRQWVAHAGLDPRACQSGTSVDKPARISKVGNAHIRRALFMPALVAVQHEPPRQGLLRQARGPREEAPPGLRRRHAEAAPRDLRDVHDRDDLRRRRSSMLPLDNGESI